MEDHSGAEVSRDVRGRAAVVAPPVELETERPRSSLERLGLPDAGGESLDRAEAQVLV
jgi:hypothetical protein